MTCTANLIILKKLRQQLNLSLKKVESGRRWKVEILQITDTKTDIIFSNYTKITDNINTDIIFYFY